MTAFSNPPGPLTDETDTLLTLIGALAPDAGPWRVSTFGQIRNVRDQCPICAVANIIQGDVLWRVEAPTANTLTIGASLYALDSVIRAADHSEHPLRPVLCDVLGIKRTN